MTATEATTYNIDAVHSTALFRVHHLQAGQFWGRFNQVDGTFGYDEGGNGPTLDVTIAIDSIDTATEGLDRHLKSPDFFNAREYATMSFKSSSSRKIADNRYAVTGTLTIRDIAQTITAEVDFTGKSNMGRFGPRCGLEARFTIQRSKHEVMYGIDTGAVGDEVKVIVGLEGVSAES